MKPEKENLIGDLLGENSGREATLLAGTRILRRRRHWRAVSRGAGVLAMVIVAAVLMLRKDAPSPVSPRIASVTPKAATTAQVRALTDDELLGLFPDTPVALASLPDGKKRLIFPRPGDEARFITRL
jgi:hypothetical protein